MRRLTKVASPLIAIAITIGSVQSLASTPEAETPPQPIATEVTVLPELISVSRVLTSGALERVDAESVPGSVRAVLDASGAVLVVATPQAGGLQ
ncbi:MAG: hypothetical protein HKO87_09295 [Acidimicrobiia bacterium]|nr:hypothetical protein [Acidimicrobiia bacterium]